MDDRTAVRQRFGGQEIVTGQARYAGDVTLPGMLHAKVLRSPHPHAAIGGIDFSRALALPGVVAAASHADVPRYPTDRPFLADKARFVGDAVAAVAATDIETAEEALDLIDVAWKPLPAVTDPLTALLHPAGLHGSPAVLPVSAPARAASPHPAAARPATVSVTTGDVPAALRSADIVVRGRYDTPFQCHAHIETQTCLARWDSDEQLTVWNTVQHPLSNRDSLARIFGLPAEAVRVICPYVGGSFGGKDAADEGKPHEDAIAVLLARMTGAPVRLRVSHRENLACLTGRHPFRTHLTAAATVDGRITGLDAFVVQATGAYADDGADVLRTAAAVLATSYRHAAVRLRGYAVFTNTPVGGEMWGFGAPQITFAAEAHLDRIARRLGLDSGQVRRINATVTGDPLPGALGAVLRHKQARSLECLEACELAAPGTSPPTGAGRAGAGAGPSADPAASQLPGRRFSILTSGLRMTAENSGHGDSDGLVVLRPDGRFLVPAGIGNMGTGSPAALAQMVAGILGERPQNIELTWGDTDGSGWDPSGEGSRALHCTGQAVANAAWDIRDQLLAAASAVLGVPSSRLSMHAGWVLDKGCPALPLAAVASRSGKRTDGPWFGGAGGRRAKFGERFLGRRVLPHRETLAAAARYESCVVGLGFGTRDVRRTPWAAQQARVSVNARSGAVHLDTLVTACDAGRIIAPRGAEAQILGGSVLSTGYALREEFLIDARSGAPLTVELRELGVCGFADAPHVVAHFLEPRPGDPPLGIGETAVQGAAAIANAVAAATRRPVTTLPIRPDAVLAAMAREPHAG